MTSDKEVLDFLTDDPQLKANMVLSLVGEVTNDKTPKMLENLKEVLKELSEDLESPTYELTGITLTAVFREKSNPQAVKRLACLMGGPALIISNHLYWYDTTRDALGSVIEMVRQRLDGEDTEPPKGYLADIIANLTKEKPHG